MRTIITLDKYNGRNGKRNLREQFYSRSFTRGFIEMLYVGAAQIGSGAPYELSKDLDSCLQTTIISADTSYTYRQHQHMRVASGGGDSAMVVFANVYSTTIFPIDYHIPSQDLGIMVGNGSTPVSPLDRRLAARIGHGYEAADISPVLKEQYAGVDDTNADISSTSMRWAQAFTPQHDYKVTSVKLKLWRTGSTGTVTVRIRGSHLGGAQVPSGSYADDLGIATIDESAIGTSSPGALVEATFTTPVSVHAGHLYWICVETAESAHLYWRYDTSNITNYFGGLNYWNGVTVLSAIATSYDSGATYSLSSSSGDNCFIFEVYGQSLGDFEYDGCVLGNLIFSDPNGTFKIRRRFHNLSGGGITVNELGIGAASGYYPNRWNAKLIARDVLGSSVLVADNEVLEVTYTPQITV
jgi:hypothetical protein